MGSMDRRVTGEQPTNQNEQAKLAGAGFDRDELRHIDEEISGRHCRFEYDEPGSDLSDSDEQDDIIRGPKE